ncbi:P-loop containing nucleoside triphosphate hydrolase protein [Ilyonectria sp. MPI-CAGE-AT-0026]|nr:P-loop containing nucleoside triphosphate hydrolase protein [Ilyonectria sp. MPI-CAGE-AT-0026]
MDVSSSLKGHLGPAQKARNKRQHGSSDWSRTPNDSMKRVCGNEGSMSWEQSAVPLENLDLPFYQHTASTQAAQNSEPWPILACINPELSMDIDQASVVLPQHDNHTIIPFSQAVTPETGSFIRQTYSDQPTDIESHIFARDSTSMELDETWEEGLPPGTSHQSDAKLIRVPDTSSYDTCFGVVEVQGITTVSGSSKRPKSEEKIGLDIQTHFIRLYNPTSNQFMGLVPPDYAKAMTRLVELYNTTLSAVIKNGSTLALTVYGAQEKGIAIGNFLSEHQVFLQDPERYDPSIPYINAQVLLPPGVDFQPWYTSSQVEEVESKSSTAVKSTMVSTIKRVIDCASGPTSFSEVQVDYRLRTELKTHQRKALSMMVEKQSGNIASPEFPSLWMEITGKNGKRYKNTITGSFRQKHPALTLGGHGAWQKSHRPGFDRSTLSYSFPSPQNSEVLKPMTLVIAPLSTLPNWENEIIKHFNSDSIKFTTYHGPKRTEETESLQGCEIVLTTYDVVKADFFKATRAKAAEPNPLHTHIIRSHKTKVFEAVFALTARHRWCLTGTPIQNGIEDLGSLIRFLKIAPYDNPTTFNKTFVDPIRREQPQGWTRLNLLVKAIALRRTKETKGLNLQLPPREEVVFPVQLDVDEKHIYDHLVRAVTQGLNSPMANDSVFQTFLRLRQLCNHRKLLPKVLQDWLAKAVRSVDTLPHDILAIRTCEYCFEDISEGPEKPLLCLHSICPRCLIKPTHQDRIDSQSCPLCSDDAPVEPQRHSICVDPDYKPSSKVRALLRNLREAGCDSTGKPIKSLVFSSWTRMLDVLETAVSGAGFVYQRIDGTKTLQQRRETLRRFKEEPSCTILLASLGSAAVGLDLTAASHVHLIEPSWNPMLERQALDRVHRLGQQKPVRAVRYIVDTEDSIEQHILRVQKRKMQLMSASFADEEAARENLNTAVQDMTEVFRERQLLLL